MIIALVQAEALHDKQRNLDYALQLIREAALRGARLVVFPEMFMALPEVGKGVAPKAENFDGPFVRALLDAARRNNLAVICGIWEFAGDNRRVFNTVVAVSADGQLTARYRKLHLFDALSVQESSIMRAGDEVPPVFEIDSVKIGLAICYDLRFPELFRDLSARGADLIVVPSAWYAGPYKEDHWLTMLRARAIENTCYVAGANLTGKAFAGRTSLVDPFGVVRATATEGADIVYGSISRDRLEEVRTKLPALVHRRNDIYPLGRANLDGVLAS
jgi:predicted amidohydrolase